jgi:hypothetical protein
MMISQVPLWLVMARELFVTTGLDIGSPWAQPVIWTIIIVVVLVARASKVGKAAIDLLAAAELG